MNSTPLKKIKTLETADIPCCRYFVFWICFNMNNLRDNSINDDWLRGQLSMLIWYYILEPFKGCRIYFAHQVIKSV